MQLKDEDLIKFQELYKSHYNMELSREDAYEKAMKLLRLVQIVYRPIPEDTMQKKQDILATDDKCIKVEDA